MRSQLAYGQQTDKTMLDISQHFNSTPIYVYNANIKTAIYNSNVAWTFEICGVPSACACSVEYCDRSEYQLANRNRPLAPQPRYLARQLSVSGLNVSCVGKLIFSFITLTSVFRVIHRTKSNSSELLRKMVCIIY